MSIYKIYLTVPEKIFNTRLKYLIDSVDKINYKIKGEDIVILYAWTTKKKYVKRFLEERCEHIFTVKKDEITYDDEYDDFIDRNSKSELYAENIALFPSYDKYERYNDVEISDKNHFINMIVTKYEAENFSNYRSENMCEFGPKISADVDYEIFNDEITEALTVLGYATMYDSSYSQYFPESDKVVRRYEKAMRVENLIETGIDEITPLLLTEYVVFIYLYSFTFIGK